MRNRYLKLRSSDAEKERWNEAARNKSKNLSQWIRDTLDRAAARQRNQRRSRQSNAEAQE